MFHQQDRNFRSRDMERDNYAMHDMDIRGYDRPRGMPGFHIATSSLNRHNRSGPESYGYERHDDRRRFMNTIPETRGTDMREHTRGGYGVAREPTRQQFDLRGNIRQPGPDIRRDHEMGHEMRRSERVPENFSSSQGRRPEIRQEHDIERRSERNVVEMRRQPEMRGPEMRRNPERQREVGIGRSEMIMAPERREVERRKPPEMRRRESQRDPEKLRGPEIIDSGMRGHVARPSEGRRPDMQRRHGMQGSEARSVRTNDPNEPLTDIQISEMQRRNVNSQIPNENIQRLNLNTANHSQNGHLPMNRHLPMNGHYIKNQRNAAPSQRPDRFPRRHGHAPSLMGTLRRNMAMREIEEDPEVSVSF